jgi:hypothetical protein
LAVPLGVYASPTVTKKVVGVFVFSCAAGEG